MTGYLEVEAGKFHLLLHASSVVEVLVLSQAEKSQQHQEHWWWRDSSIPMHSLAARLGQERGEGLPEPFGIIYQNPQEQNPCLIQVTRVHQLVHLQEDDLLPLPPLPPQVLKLFDRVYVRPGQDMQLYLCHHQLDFNPIHPPLGAKGQDA